jgi:hypothetical protein
VGAAIAAIRGRRDVVEDRVAGKRWSQHVAETSNALDLKEGVFKGSDPKKIARSLKASAEHSDRRRAIRTARRCRC